MKYPLKAVSVKTELTMNINKLFLSIGVVTILFAGLLSAHTASARSPESSLAMPDYQKIVLMELSSLGSTNDAVRTIEQILIGEMRKLLGDKLYLYSDLLAQGTEVENALDECQGNKDCLAEVVGALGWDAFVVGNIAGLGESRVINIKLIDAHNGKEIRRASEKASGDESQLVTNMRKGAVFIIAPERFVGTLEIITKQKGVEILIDGESRGVTPLENPRFKIKAGSRALEARRDGLVPYSSIVKLGYGEIKQIHIKLAESTAVMGADTPFRHRWWSWALAGAGVVATGLGGYFNYLHSDTVDLVNQRAAEGSFTAADLDLIDDSEADWSRAKTFYSVGGAMIGGVGILFVVDFF